jgi:hypothetical protein
MDPSLQRVQVNVSRTLGPGEIQEAVQHIRLPGPSLWPLLLSIAIIVFVVGLMLLFISDFPWVALVSLVFVFIGIMGWAMENPNAKMKLESPISLMPTMKLESPISLIPTTKLNAIQINIQESAVRPVESDSRPINSYQVKEAKRDPAARQDDLFHNKFHRF